MKLTEIIEPTVDTEKLKTTFLQNKDEWLDRRLKSNAKNPGVFFNVEDIPENPHEIIKVSKYPTKSKRDDPQQIYLKTLADKKLTGNNNFAPRVYNIKKTVDSDDNVFYEFQTEKLIHGEELSNDEILLMIDQILPYLFGRTEDRIEQYERSFKSKMPKFLIVHDIGKELEKMLNAGQFDTDSKELNELLKVIRDIKTENKLEYDLHGNNIMFRRTPYGVQMVLNDPLKQ